MKNFRVGAIVPCHNEETSIETAIDSLVLQTYPLEKIVVVDDASDDSTWDILQRLKPKIPQLVTLRSISPLYRAGALNFGLSQIGADVDLILRVDADTYVTSQFVEIAIKDFLHYPKLGGVCGRAGLASGKGLLYRLQKIEYGAGFDAERTASFDHVLVLHGMATMFRYSALRAIKGFSLGHRIEDYEATLRLKYLGYQVRYNPLLLAETKPPETIFALLKQRYRWMRGGLDVLLTHGINQHTVMDFMDHLFFLLLLSLVLIIVGFSMGFGSHLHFKPHLVSSLLGISTYIVSLYRLKFVQRLNRSDIILRLILLPELFLTLLFSFVQLYAYITCLFDCLTHLVKKFLLKISVNTLNFERKI